MEQAPTPSLSPHEQAFADYQLDPTPTRLNAVVSALQPSINSALRSIGSGDDPIVAMKAKVLAGRAVKTFNPSNGAKLPTWVSQQLMPLRRFKRTALAPVRVPERIQLDALQLMQAEQEFMDRHNREPDVLELSDHAKLPVKRIEDIRRTFRRVAAQSAFGENPSLPSDQSETSFTDEAMEYVYRDADYLDRKILELKTGYGGNNDPLPPQEIARRLNLSPASLSRRSAKLAIQIAEMRDALGEVHT